MTSKDLLATVQVSICIVFVLGAIIWAIDRNNESNHDDKIACIKAGGSWVSGNQCLHVKEEP
jgi:hypothetical protein